MRVRRRRRLERRGGRVRRRRRTAFWEGSTLVRGRAAPLDSLALLYTLSPAAESTDEEREVAKVNSRRTWLSLVSPFALLPRRPPVLHPRALAHRRTPVRQTGPSSPLEVEVARCSTRSALFLALLTRCRLIHYDARILTRIPAQQRPQDPRRRTRVRSPSPPRVDPHIASCVLTR